MHTVGQILGLLVTVYLIICLFVYDFVKNKSSQKPATRDTVNNVHTCTMDNRFDVSKPLI